MTPKLCELLKGDIETLFTNGACHVFARALIKRFPEYGLRCVRLQQWLEPIGKPRQKFGRERLLHVYAFHKGEMIDVNGRGCENEWFKNFVGKNPHYSNSSGHVEPKFRTGSCKVFFSVSKFQTDENGAKSCDGLYLDADFVSGATELAAAHIKANLDKYGPT